MSATVKNINLVHQESSMLPQFLFWLFAHEDLKWSALRPASWFLFKSVVR